MESYVFLEADESESNLLCKICKGFLVLNSREAMGR